MRKIATIAAFIGLVTAEAGAFAQAVPGAAPGLNQAGAPTADGRRRRITDDPAKLILSLAALTEFILVFVVATRSKNGGRPASP
jgi:hypothetical protein